MNLPATIENYLEDIQRDLQPYETSDVIACARKVYQHLEKSITTVDDQNTIGLLSAKRSMVMGIISQYSASH